MPVVEVTGSTSRAVVPPLSSSAPHTSTGSGRTFPPPSSQPLTGDQTKQFSETQCAGSVPGAAELKDDVPLNRRRRFVMGESSRNVRPRTEGPGESSRGPSTREEIVDLLRGLADVSPMGGFDLSASSDFELQPGLAMFRHLYHVDFFRSVESKDADTLVVGMDLCRVSNSFFFILLFPNFRKDSK